MPRPTCCAEQRIHVLFSWKVPFSGEHMRVLFCLICRAQYTVEVTKPYQPKRAFQR